MAYIALFVAVMVFIAAAISEYLWWRQMKRLERRIDHLEGIANQTWGGNGGKGPGGAYPCDGSGRTFRTSGDWNKPKAGEPATIEVQGGDDDTTSWAGGGGGSAA